MSHQLLEEDRLTICNSLTVKNNGAWKDLVSEIDPDKGEIFIWILLNGSEYISSAADVIFQVLPQFVRAMEGISFFVTLFEKNDSSKIAWEMFENPELLAGSPSWSLGKSPDVRPLADYDVFGKNDTGSK